MTKPCAHCETIMQRPAWAADSQWASRRYCSHSCVAKARWATHETATKNCTSCGQIFEKNAKYSKAQWEKAEFCSNECRWQERRLERPLCACGCGEQVAKPHSLWRQGHNPHDYRRKLFQVSTSNGKTRWYVNDRYGKKHYWARIVMMGELGRDLLPNEVVHHMNGDSQDDRLENLAIFPSHSDHMREEYKAGNLPAMN